MAQDTAKFCSHLYQCILPHSSNWLDKWLGWGIQKLNIAIFSEQYLQDIQLEYKDEGRIILE
jgi:hypothetical protein